MADLQKHQVYKNERFEILTDDGFKNFKGIIIGNNDTKIILSFENNIKLVCTPKHKIVLINKTFCFAKDLNVGDTVYSGLKLINKENITSDEPVYELLHVENTHRYFVNDILSQQCLLIDEAAFIPPEFMDDFWESVFPVISSSKKSKIFMLSTPNGVGNLFFNTYTDAIAEKNGWHAERVDWWEVPGRDEKWKEMTARALGSVEAFNQEYGNEFRAAGENIFDKDQLDELTQNAPEPVFEDDDGYFKIYKDHKDGHFYSIGVDVGEGIGRANSVIQVIDVTDLTNIEQVATYANNKLDPFNFTGKLVEIAGQWGNPPLLVERNNCGAQVVDALTHTHQYPNIVKYTPSMGTFTDKVEKDNRLGVYSHTNSKFNSMANFRYWMNVLRCVKLYDKPTIEEFKTYIRQPNGIWKKQSDKYLDDRVEALIWAMFILDPKVVEQFYEVTQQDANGKPLKMIPNNWDPFIVSMPKPSEIYRRTADRDRENVVAPNPVIMPGAHKEPNPANDEMEELLEQGWRLPHGSPAAGMLDRRFLSQPGQFYNRP